MPHDLEFPYRPHLLTAFLAGAFLTALVDPASHSSERLPDVLFIAVVAVACYGTMRLFVWAALRPLAATSPRLVRYWGLGWFYGAIPLLLLGLFVGTARLAGGTPNATTIASVVVAAASMAAGAFPAVRVASGSSNNRSRVP